MINQDNISFYSHCSDPVKWLSPARAELFEVTGLDCLKLMVP